MKEARAPANSSSNPSLNNIIRKFWRKVNKTRGLPNLL